MIRKIKWCFIIDMILEIAYLISLGFFQKITIRKEALLKFVWHLLSYEAFFHHSLI